MYSHDIFFITFPNFPSLSFSFFPSPEGGGAGFPSPGGGGGGFPSPGGGGAGFLRGVLALAPALAFQNHSMA